MARPKKFDISYQLLTGAPVLRWQSSTVDAIDDSIALIDGITVLYRPNGKRRREKLKRERRGEREEEEEEEPRENTSDP